jgi:hypothetical protein
MRQFILLVGGFNSFNFTIMPHNPDICYGYALIYLNYVRILK